MIANNSASIFDTSSTTLISSCKNIELNELTREVTKAIEQNDSSRLRMLVENHYPTFSPEIFELCAKHLADDCFFFLYAMRTKNEVLVENKFKKLATEMAKQGKNFDGRDFWSAPHKRAATVPRPAAYTIPSACIVPESVFIIVLKANKEKGKNFLKKMMIMFIPIGDHVIYNMNSDQDIQGYVSMVHRYMIERSFNIYPGMLRKMVRANEIYASQFDSY